MAYVAKPSIVSRSSWGAVANTCQTNLPKANVTKLVIHHCASADSRVNRDSAQVHQKYIQELHKGIKYCDIGYHFGVGRDGTILEGMPLTKQGYHTLNNNHYTLGVVLHGNFNSLSFGGTQKTGLEKILAWLCYDYGLQASDITYHQALSSSDCPGKNVISQISSIRSNVHKILNGGPISG